MVFAKIVFMSNTKAKNNSLHSPGPWSGREGIAAADGILVCMLAGENLNGTKRTQEEWNANSRLIAAAPTMLDVIESLATLNLSDAKENELRALIVRAALILKSVN